MNVQRQHDSNGLRAQEKNMNKQRVWFVTGVLCPAQFVDRENASGKIPETQ